MNVIDLMTLLDDIRISQEQEHIELDGDEEDDEPIFVLTDEWREFFAKSEAKRKLGNSRHTYFIHTTYSHVMLLFVLNCNFLFSSDLTVEKLSMSYTV